MSKVKVIDSFGAANDLSMPQLAVALQRRLVGPLLKRGLRTLIHGDEVLRLSGIKVLRHKPGKRCVIQYDVFIEPPGDPLQAFAILGKIRANRAPNSSFNLQEAFWKAGFNDHSVDLISVPEPVGIIDELQMWFQRKVAGETATNLITPDASLEIVRRIAGAAAKIHDARVPTAKSHSLADELRILHNCFTALSQRHPQFTARFQKLFAGCEQAAQRLGQRPALGIHRDFYSDQILFDGSRLFVLDFDLYCQGDPALDIGNFIGHLTEQALRLHGHADALSRAEKALEERFLELSGPNHRDAVRLYTNLTLARHIFLSAQFPERSHLTEPLLFLCEERFSK